MEWTTTKPESKGHYWRRNHSQGFPVVVYVDESLTMRWLDIACSVYDLGGEWSNQPIDPPSEAREE